MKHIIIGAGVIGQATGYWLYANGHDVCFNDVNKETLQKIRDKGFHTCHDKKDIAKEFPEIIWICTAEWDVEHVLHDIYDTECDCIIVIRSTMKPGELEKVQKKYGLAHLAHVPEFLRQKTAINDTFNNSRIVVGTTDDVSWSVLQKVFAPAHIPIIHTNMIESSLIKYAANNWLALQISFWNEIKCLADSFDTINPQLIAEVTAMDPRISKYGSALIKEPFAGFCFPKDSKALQEIFKEQEVPERTITALRDTNKYIEIHRMKK